MGPTTAADHELAAMLPRVAAAVTALDGEPDGSFDLSRFGATALLRSFREGTSTPAEAVEQCLAGLAGVDGRPSCDGGLGAIWAVDGERSLAAAEVSTRRWATGRARPLEGVPIVVKDLLDTAGLLTSGGSSWLDGRTPVADAAVVAAVRAAGAIVVAKTSTFELGCGDEQMPRGHTVNPFDRSCTTGGSSAGSAAALAARLAPLALGTDTGGSIRIPSSYCGVVGLKPTLGRLSCAGLIGLAPTLDTPGPMARSAADVGLLFAVLTGEPPPAELPTLAGVVVGVARRWFCDVLAADVADAFEQAVGALAGLGATVLEIDIEAAEHGAPLSWLITMAEAARTYRDAPRHALTPAFRSRLEVGDRIDASTYAGALRARHALTETVLRTIARCDVVAVPATVSAAPPFADLARPVAGVAVTWPDVTARTMALWNVTGLPALSVPIGRGDGGLPLGMQIVGRPFADERCIAVAAAYQTVTDHHLAVPQRPAPRQPAATSNGDHP